MNASERDEIAASVAAHAELGPRYDGAVAEGLVERIGEEIDKRIDARLGGQAQPAQPRPVPVTNGNHVPPGYYGPAAPTPAMPYAVPAPPVQRRSGGLSALSGVVLGLGSMGLGLGATAIVVSHHVESVAALLMVLLIWAAITAINVAHARRKL